MEITRVPQIAKTAPQAEPVAPGPALEARAADPNATKLAQQRKLREALADVILKQSDIPAEELSKVRVRLDMDSESGRLIAAIENKQTGEVVQTIPSETILRGAAMLEKVIGTVLDKPA